MPLHALALAKLTGPRVKGAGNPAVPSNDAVPCHGAGDQAPRAELQQPGRSLQVSHRCEVRNLRPAGLRSSIPTLKSPCYSSPDPLEKNSCLTNNPLPTFAKPHPKASVLSIIIHILPMGN
uniref:Uncharacterized protein n=1 Tax=Pelusios castaneus TaxID=367368 RepID=A0A8C8SSK2_9SAUR